MLVVYLAIMILVIGLNTENTFNVNSYFDFTKLQVVDVNEAIKLILRLGQPAPLSVCDTLEMLYLRVSIN